MGQYYRNVEQYLDRIDSGVWVEIGVERGEGSTRWFADQARQHRATHFYAVDAMQEQVQRCTALLEHNGALPADVSVVHSRGEGFLTNLQRTIGSNRVSLAYLDNFDWDYWLGGQEESFVAGVKARYENELNIKMNNFNSQLTHLAQAINLHGMLSDNCIVICDDTWYEPDHGVFMGKCSAAIPFLILMAKMKVLHTAGRRQNSGVILGRLGE